jgi:hypothetical protein
MARLSWRRQPNETGLQAVCQSERDYELRFGGELVGCVSRSSKGFYYFYGCGKNSLQHGLVFDDLEKAKNSCKEWVVGSDEFRLIKDRG